MIISSNVQFKDSIPLDVAETYAESSFTVTENDVTIPLYEWYKEDTFNAELDELYAFCRDTKSKVKGNIFLVRKANDDVGTDLVQHCIKLGTKSYKMDECSFIISVRSNKPKKKSLTEDEKVALFKEYWESKHQVPPPKEVYKDFRIGAFYESCKRNGDMLHVLTLITEEK